MCISACILIHIQLGSIMSKILIMAIEEVSHDKGFGNNVMKSSKS